MDNDATTILDSIMLVTELERDRSRLEQSALNSLTEEERDYRKGIHQGFLQCLTKVQDFVRGQAEKEIDNLGNRVQRAEALSRNNR